MKHQHALQWFRWIGLSALLLAGAVYADLDSRDTDNPYGVLEFLEYNHDWNHFQYDTPEKLEKACTFMEEAGVGFVRITFSWDDMEPEAGHYIFEKYDHLVDLVTRHHMKVLAILAFNATSHGGDWNSPPDEAAYTAFATALVHRYKDRVMYWEIWNEPDLRDYWTEQDDMKAYTHLLKTVYPAIKKEDPTSKVVLGGLTNAAPFALRRIYQNGGREFFDVMNFHPFVNPLNTNALGTVHGVYASVHKVMEDNKDQNKPIWITEISCPGLPKSVTSKGSFLGKSPTELEQAKWVSTVLAEAVRWQGVQRVFWAGFRDTDDKFHDDMDYMGLIRNDFSKKPAFEAYKQLAHKTSHP